MQRRFKDRAESGRLLAKQLLVYGGRADVLVLGLPRGGVPVATEVAKALGAPVDVCLVRKLGTPGHEELAMGAIASGCVRVLNEALIRTLQISPQAIEAEAAREGAELARRELRYRRGRAPLDLVGKVVILVDDGIATGATMLAAVRALRLLAPAKIVVAVPIAPPTSLTTLEAEADEVTCLRPVEDLIAVGHWYEDFRPTTDEEVQSCLEFVPK